MLDTSGLPGVLDYLAYAVVAEHWFGCLLKSMHAEPRTGHARKVADPLHWLRRLQARLSSRRDLGGVLLLPGGEWCLALRCSWQRFSGWSVT